MENYLDGLKDRQKQALKLVEALIDLEPDRGTMAYARKMQRRLKLPMSVVLEKLYPKLTIQEKVEKLGITRQAYYLWLYGLARPSPKMSRKIAGLTRYDAEAIRGKL